VKYVGDKADEIFHRYDFSHTIWSYPVFDSDDWKPCDAASVPDPIDQGTVFRETITVDLTAHDVSWGNPMDIVALDEDIAIATFGSYYAEQDLDEQTFSTAQSLPGRVGYTLDGGMTWDEIDFSQAAATCTAVTDLQYDLFGKYARLALVEDTTWYTDSEDWGLDFFLLGQDSGDLYDLGGQDCAVWRVTLVTTAGPTTTTSWTPVSVPFETDGCTIETATGLSIAPWQERLLLWSGYTQIANGPDALTERGGLCLMDFDGSNATGILDPADGYRFAIKDVVPNPLVQDQWVVTPFVDDQVQDQCAKQRSGGVTSIDGADVYDACDVPIPFLYQRRGPGAPGPDWVATDLSIDGLNSLQGTELDLDAGAVEAPPGTWNVDLALLYGTTGTGSFRGVATW